MERLLLIFLIIQGVWSADWKVIFKNQCALKGASVVIKCQYDYPAGHIVTSVQWSKALYEHDRWGLFPLSELSSARNHFTYVGNYWSDCGLKISNVQHSDEGQYFFSFWTTLSRWTSSTYAYLSVKELTAFVNPSTVTEGDDVSLTCVSGCLTTVNIIWFRDGQPVLNPLFQARKKDAGRYYCAIRGQEVIRSASVALNVKYAPTKVTLSVSPSGAVVRGSSVTLRCSSDARPPVTQRGYSLFKDGHFISSGQSLAISDIQPSHSGLYFCQAWNNVSQRGIAFMNSTEVHLDVHYHPVNISVSMNPLHVVRGSSVNLTCSSAANPAADKYTWYKRTDARSSMLQVGSGQVLSFPSVNTSHTGLYLCQARNPVGENRSAEVLLAVKENGNPSLPIIAGIGVSLFVTLVFALLVLWRKQRTLKEKKAMFDSRLSGQVSEDQSTSVYINIHKLASAPLPVTDIMPHSERSSWHQRDVNMDPTSPEDEVTYSAVTIMPKNAGLNYHKDNSRVPQSKAGKEYGSVIYSTVAESN